MKRVMLIATLALLFASGSALAQVATCTSKAVGKDGMPLHGAAKASFIKKCCSDSAISKDGKALHGAAKSSFVKKCVASE
jgi:hypothetical protein